jgi:putative addiction module component (TIGR02574 family)
MVVAVEKLKAELAALTESERADLAQFLLNSLDESNAEADAEIEAAWDIELARRVDGIRNGTAQGKPANEVFAELREQYS